LRIHTEARCTRETAKDAVDKATFTHTCDGRLRSEQLCQRCSRKVLAVQYVPPTFCGPQILLGHADNGTTALGRQTSEDWTLPIPGKELVAMALPEQTDGIDGLLICLP